MPDAMRLVCPLGPRTDAYGSTARAYEIAATREWAVSVVLAFGELQQIVDVECLPCAHGQRLVHEWKPNDITNGSWWCVFFFFCPHFSPTFFPTFFLYIGYGATN